MAHYGKTNGNITVGIQWKTTRRSVLLLMNNDSSLQRIKHVRDLTHTYDKSPNTNKKINKMIKRKAFTRRRHQKVQLFNVYFPT